MNETSITVTKHFGLTAFAGGMMLVIFGFGMNFVSIGMLLVTVAAAVMSFVMREHRGIHEFALLGLALSAVMVFLHYAFGIDGFVATLVKPYEQF